QLEVRRSRTITLSRATDRACRRSASAVDRRAPDAGKFGGGGFRKGQAGGGSFLGGTYRCARGGSRPVGGGGRGGGGRCPRGGAGLSMGNVYPERLAGSDLEQVVDTVRRFLRAEGRERAVWVVPEAASPGDLADRLRGLGMRPDDEPRTAALVAVEPPPPGPPGLVVRRAESLEEFLDSERVAAAAFQMDEKMRRAFEERAERLWPYFTAEGAIAALVAILDGEIVAFARAHFGRTAVHLSGAGTDPDQRGRGVYRALVRARWDLAVERGTPVLTVNAGEMSRPILERLGFSIVGWIDCLLDDLS